ncbi:exosortase/archaeosortase family protein [Ruegeria sp. HKCCD7255]|uniref:exosortase/archaeosortase family protein n=1 Tax=Ruegeria sp. HKCCD7255 TaxID=2683004 RepID=UPI00148863A0|nr:exosortase/archaeosortase family protein [Ruegeria sp. HKCCD7255]
MPTMKRRALIVLLFVLAAAFIITLFEPGFRTVLSAWQMPEYSHGPVSVALFVFLLLLIEAEPRKQLSHGPTVLIGATVLIVALLGAVAAHYFRLGEFSAWAFVFTAFGAHLTRAVPGRVAPLCLVYFSLLLALPLPMEIFWKIQFFLQGITAVASVGIANALFVPVTLKNNIIDVNGMYLHVAQSCSGFSYILPLWSFAVVMAVVAKAPWAVKLMLVFIAAPLAIFMNIVRVTLIIVVVYLRDSTSHVTSYAHFLEGWLIFVFSLGLLFLLLKVALKYSGSQASLADCFEFDIENVKQGAMNVMRSGSLIQGAALCAPLALASATAWFISPGTMAPRTEQPDLPKEASSWVKVQDWQGESDVSTSAGSIEVQGIYVQNLPFETVEFARLSRSGESAALAFPLEFVEIGGEWEVEAMGTDIVAVANDQMLHLAEVVLVRGFQRRIALVWFENTCGTAATLTAAKWLAHCQGYGTGQVHGTWQRVSVEIFTTPEASTRARILLHEFARGLRGAAL